MFRVDVYRPKEATPSSSPLYACLATASENGQLFTVGRKNATILFETDKSVSRDHLHLYLMSHHKEHQTALEDNKYAAAAMVPESKEEIEACQQNNSLGMALLVKNFGKFGSAVVAIEPKSADEDDGTEEKKPSENDSETDVGGSDTEDESQKKTAPNEFGLPVVPGLTWFDQTKAVVQQFSSKDFKLTAKKLDFKESFVVPGKACTILIECGQVGSLLVLTRLDLTICKSVVSVKDAALWKKQAYTVGADWIEKDAEIMIQKKKQEPSTKGGPPTLYMVTREQREPVAKHLIAWLLDIPIVTIGFMDALIQRKSIKDPWPKLEDFAPSNKATKEDIDDNFWDEKYPTKARVWESCTYLCSSDTQKELELLVRAAGGRAISLYSMKVAEAKEYVEKLTEDPDQKNCLFSIPPPSKSGRSSVVSWIKSQGIPLFSNKDIVRSLCRQKLPQDKNGEHVVGREVVVVAEAGEKQKEKVDEKSSTSSRKVDKKSSEWDNKADTKETISDKAKPPEETSKPSEPESISKKTARSPKRKRSGSEADDSAVNLEDDEVGIQSKKTCKDKKENQRAMEALSPLQEEEDSMDLDEPKADNKEEPEEMENRRKKKRSREDEEEERPKATSKKGKEVSSSHIEVQQEGSGKARLETTDDGWLVAAPKDELRRREYLKPREQIIENCSLEKPPEAGETVVCTGLVCRKYDPNRNYRAASIGMKSSGGKDFKKFRKNPIIKGGSRIQLRSVLPKETVRQKQLEQQQRALEAQQRKADELFHGDGGARQTKIKKAATRKRRNV